MFDQSYLQLYFIMGSNNTELDPVYVLEEAIKGGITAFQYREKGKHAKTDDKKIQLGYTLRDICKEHNIPFIVNDSVDLALQLQADGLHIGQQDGDITEIRKRVPNDL